MKTFLMCLVVPLTFLSCKKDGEKIGEDDGMLGAYHNFGASIRIVDSRGTDLLDPKTGKYTYDDIDVMVWRGKKTVPYRSYELESPVFADYPKGFRIHNKAGISPYYVLGIELGVGNKEDMSSKDNLFYSLGLRLGKNGRTYQLRGEAKVFRSENGSHCLGCGGGSTVTERIWLDEKLVWEPDKEEKLPPGDRSPEITIVVPD